MSTALITGANKGIGVETARVLLEAGWTVWVGSRDAGRGRAVVETLPGDARLLRIDVTDDDSVRAAADEVAGSGLDVLVNNAGIAGPEEAFPDARALAGVLDVNLLGAVRTVPAFLPILQRSDAARVVNVSSGLASFTRMTDPATPDSSFSYPGYAATKAALNMLTVHFARTIDSVRFVVVEPGFTATDLNDHTGRQTPQQAGAVVARAVTDDLPTGSFVGGDGPMRW